MTLNTSTMNLSAKLKPVLNRVVQSAVAGSVMALLERADGPLATIASGAAPEPGYTCQVLTYHFIENVEGFAEQVAYLARHYDVIPMNELLTAVRQGSKLPPRALLITFDDAYTNFGDDAWPVLRQYRLPVTVFVPTAYPGQVGRSFWWDQLSYGLMRTKRREPLAVAQYVTPGMRLGLDRVPLQTAKQRKQSIRQMKQLLWQLPPDQVQDVLAELMEQLDVTPPASDVLSWDRLRELAAGGVTLGAHTRNHPNLALLAASDVKAEVSGSLEDLRREVGHQHPGSVLPVLAYPGGYYNHETVEAVAETEIELAFTVARGTNDIRQALDEAGDGTWRLQLRRNNVGVAATLPVLRARLLQAAHSFHLVRQLMPGHGG